MSDTQVVLHDVSQVSPDWDDRQPVLPEEGAHLQTSDGRSLRLSPDVVRLLNVSLSAIREGLVPHLELDEECVSAERAAELLGVSRPTIYAWQDREILSRVTRGNRRLVPLESVTAYLAAAKEREQFAAAVAATPDTLDGVTVSEDTRRKFVPNGAVADAISSIRGAVSGTSIA
jgi:excisionase family DNA binding protein